MISPYFILNLSLYALLVNVNPTECTLKCEYIGRVEQSGIENHRGYDRIVCPHVGEERANDYCFRACFQLNKGFHDGFCKDYFCECQKPCEGKSSANPMPKSCAEACVTFNKTLYVSGSCNGENDCDCTTFDAPCLNLPSLQSNRDCTYNCKKYKKGYNFGKCISQKCECGNLCGGENGYLENILCGRYCAKYEENPIGVCKNDNCKCIENNPSQICHDYEGFEAEARCTQTCEFYSFNYGSCPGRVDKGASPIGYMCACYDLCADPFGVKANEDCAKHCNTQDKKQSGGTCNRQTHRCDCTYAVQDVCHFNTQKGSEKCHSSCIDSGKLFGGACKNHMCKCYEPCESRGHNNFASKSCAEECIKLNETFYIDGSCNENEECACTRFDLPCLGQPTQQADEDCTENCKRYRVASHTGRCENQKCQCTESCTIEDKFDGNLLCGDYCSRKNSATIGVCRGSSCKCIGKTVDACLHYEGATAIAVCTQICPKKALYRVLAFCTDYGCKCLLQYHGE